MAAHSYEDLAIHVGHELEAVNYAGFNATIECLTCGEVLLGFERDDEPAREGRQPSSRKRSFTVTPTVHEHVTCDECGQTATLSPPQTVPWERAHLRTHERVSDYDEVHSDGMMP